MIRPSRYGQHALPPDARHFQHRPEAELPRGPAEAQDLPIGFEHPAAEGLGKAVAVEVAFGIGAQLADLNSRRR